ncbi:hypothetical protein ANCCAN_05841 [Ancylostoma caninum]|uniref:Uncharacterized protein n=1 Tax=Ancylostoma caninum TaxID=29170 RepID=A0A368GYR4_ANCCA|nr:hypothetical protein ANCCAN_05841 [Ancylostoma caninum]
MLRVRSELRNACSPMRCSDHFVSRTIHRMRLVWNSTIFQQCLNNDYGESKALLSDRRLVILLLQSSRRAPDEGIDKFINIATMLLWKAVIPVALLVCFRNNIPSA